MMGQPIYNCVDPTGFYDQAEAWLDPGVLVYRWTFALQMAGGRLAGIDLPEEYYKSILEGDAKSIREKIQWTILPGGVDPATQQILEGEVASVRSKRQLAEKLLGLLLGSPTFMQQ